MTSERETPMVELDCICKNYGKLQAVKGVSLSVPRGELGVSWTTCPLPRAPLSKVERGEKGPHSVPYYARDNDHRRRTAFVPA